MDYPITLESFKDVGPILKELNLATHQNALYLDAGKEMTTLKLDLMQSFAVALLVYYLGVLLKKVIPILNKFCIPAPVAGGVVFALLHLVVRETMHFSLGIDTTFQTPFMLVFFTTIGMTASIQLIKKGGLGVIIFLIVATVLCVIQDAVGMGIAKALGQNPLLGLICGSVTMTGGHGTGAAFAPTFTEMGLKGANTFAAAAATFGLVAGSLMGGPLGAALIRKNNLKSKGAEYTDKKLEMESESEKVDFEEIFRATAIIVVAVAIGSLIAIPLKNVQLPITGPTGDPMKLNLPAYVPSMIIASIILNIGESTGAYHINQKATGVVGTIGLNAFLSLALTGLRLWELAEVAGPMLIILGVQTVVMFIFAYFVTFNVMGKDFDAAAIAGGHCGFGMGATPNGVANMTSIQEEFGPAPRAFFILPIVGAFLIDFSNMLVITIFMQFAG
jgi:sodium/glutamate symporter